MNTENDINTKEWDNPDNWSSIYFSKKDSRTYVPKRKQKGFTINFGSSSGSKWIYYLLAIFFLLGCFIGTLFTVVTIQMM